MHYKHINELILPNAHSLFRPFGSEWLEERAGRYQEICDPLVSGQFAPRTIRPGQFPPSIWTIPPPNFRTIRPRRRERQNHGI